jgi:AraC family transcriptional activator of tynA and feaB
MTGLKLEFSTGLVHPRDRFDLWHDVACKSYAQHECASETASRFHGAISTAPLALSTLSVYENSAMHLWRTARQVQRSPSERIFVCLQLENFCRIEQFGREAILAPGDFCIVDTRWPYDFTYPKQSRQLVVNVPVTQLERRVGSTDTVTGLAIAADTGIGALASGFIRMLPEHANRLSERTQAQISTQVLDLVAMALAQRAELRPARLGSASTLALMRLRYEVEQALCDPDIKCQEVSKRAGVSFRYANALLAKEGTSLQRLIQMRRLEKCRIELAQPSHRPIGDVAYAWGFSDLSHFSRAFKSAYGMSPSEYRRKNVSSQSWPETIITRVTDVA